MTDSARSQSEPATIAGGPAAILRRLGLRARKGLSQSFLTDEGVCRKMADDAELATDDEVLEIGPGLGILTRVLLERARRVVAVELDRQLAGHLPTLVGGDRLEVVQADALRFDPTLHFAGPYKLVANLPYQITSPVLRRFLIDLRRPRVLVLMVQREVAERVAARAGENSFLSVLAQSVADVQVRRSVPAGAFYPRPRVTSAVLLLRPRPTPIVPDPALLSFLSLVRAGFAQPRRTLANSLALGLQVPRQGAEARLVAAGVDPTRRPQDLTLDEWVAVFRADGAGS
jgi:16S rRNA (adenine1518-N6/adenine1519-N6)-dimethyltransferase